MENNLDGTCLCGEPECWGTQLRCVALCLSVFVACSCVHAPAGAVHESHTGLAGHQIFFLPSFLPSFRNGSTPATKDWQPKGWKLPPPRGR